jgi:hypothetical protein
MREGMRRDHSWQRAADAYLDLYADLLDAARPRLGDGGLVGKRSHETSPDEGSLDDVVSGFAAAAFAEAAGLEDRRRVAQHRGAPADHHAIVLR